MTQAGLSKTQQRLHGMSSRDAHRALYSARLVDRIQLIKSGIRAADAKLWLEMPSIGALAVLRALDLPVATFNRKVKSDDVLSKAESERVVGFARLVGQVEAMVDGAGDAENFDSRAWLSRWLTTSLPALGDVKPIDYMDTMEGQNLVSQKLAQVVSGAYA